MSSDRILAKYLIETPYTLDHAASVIAGEQSCGTFVSVPGETQALKEKYGASVETIEPLETVSTASLPGSAIPQSAQSATQYYRGLVTISFPLCNFGTSITALVSTVAGNLYELQELSGVRLIDLDFAPAFSDRYPGPGFGVEGTRRLAQVEGRPLIGTIIKPSIGLSIEALRPLVRDLAEAGLDFIKDDELNANPAFAPLDARITAVMEELDEMADKCGKKAMYAFNITGDIDDMLRGHDLVHEKGGTCVMVNVNAVGLAAVAHLRQQCELPIHGHRAFFGAISRSPSLGIGFTAFQKLWRLAGVDHLHVGGFNSKFYETNEEVAKSIRDCLEPMLGGYCAMPAISSAQWAGSAAPIYSATQTIDVIHVAGGGIIAHPNGTAAGVRSMQQGWQAAMSNRALDDYARTHSELAAAIEKFGP